MSTGLSAPREHRPGTGILLMLCAFICFTGIDTCAKLLVQTLPATEVVLFRYAGSLLIVSALFLPSQGTGLFRANRMTVQLMRAGCLMTGTALNFLALIYLPLAVTSAIFFTMPLIICALSVPLLGESVGPRRWTAIVVGFIGVLIIVRPGGSEMHWAWVLSIGATFCASLYMILTRVLAGEDSTETSQFYAALVPTIAFAPLAWSVWVMPLTLAELIPMVLIGMLGWGGHQCAVVAHRMAPATTLAPFIYTQIITMTAAGYFFFGDVPDAWVFIGAAVVIGSGLYIWLRERTLGKEIVSRAPIRR